MKIKIKEPLPVEERIRPEVGSIYDVVETEHKNRGGDIYFIESKGERVGVFARECEVLREAKS